MQQHCYAQGSVRRRIRPSVVRGFLSLLKRFPFFVSVNGTVYSPVSWVSGAAGALTRSFAQEDLETGLVVGFVMLLEPGMVMQLSTLRLRQKDPEFHVSSSYVARPCLKETAIFSPALRLGLM